MWRTETGPDTAFLLTFIMSMFATIIINYKQANQVSRLTEQLCGNTPIIIVINVLVEKSCDGEATTLLFSATLLHTLHPTASMVIDEIL